jgi:hypothetical protein
VTSYEECVDALSDLGISVEEVGTDVVIDLPTGSKQMPLYKFILLCVRVHGEVYHECRV